MDQIARAFIQHYYQTFDSNRANLASLYQPQSMLSWEGKPFQGTQAIANQLTSLPFQTVVHAITTFDVQPSPGNGLLVFVCGDLKVDNEHPMKFSQIFNLVPTETGSYFVFNDIFRLNIG
eukprot:TRINITY_DN556_c0_g1_i2.p1 TRINITY_DN556_c0_g1~~TRINITY_DN556_c0_g1_i2.p1  ORF type:complete len:120 (+),score=25.30 TRINITY_DN556_c0_g1_i2:148-507(+)